jgi:hypothetical protein
MLDALDEYFIERGEDSFLSGVSLHRESRQGINLISFDFALESKEGKTNQRRRFAYARGRDKIVSDDVDHSADSAGSLQGHSKMFMGQSGKKISSYVVSYQDIQSKL